LRGGPRDPAASRRNALQGTDAWFVASDRRDGDLRGDARGRRALVDRPWTTLRQVHGADVLVVTQPGEHGGDEGDALVTTHPHACLAVLGADCALVALGSPEGVAAVAHAGWSGLVAGVIERTVETMRSLGAETVVAYRGPCIGPECYEFSEPDLDTVAERLGEGVRARSRSGGAALDIPAAVAAALSASGAELVGASATCTACSPSHFSHRARRDTGRQAVAVWRDCEREVG
jgi:YfiH family protein